MVVFEFFVCELFLQLDPGVFAVETATFGIMPAIRVGRNAHRKQNRVPSAARSNTHHSNRGQLMSTKTGGERGEGGEDLLRRAWPNVEEKLEIAAPTNVVDIDKLLPALLGKLTIMG